MNATATVYIVKMTEDATGKTTYVTPRGNAKAKAKAWKFARHTREQVQTFADEWAATNEGYTFTVEEF